MALRRRAAVIGSGIAGLTAAYLLERDYEVSLYEADDRLGGHAHSHDIVTAERALTVDSGFIVHNERTYPTLLRLFRELGVATQDAEMSMSVRCEGCGLEYAGARRVAGLISGPRSLLRGRYLRMLSEVPKFHAAAKAVLASDGTSGSGRFSPSLTLGEFLAGQRFSRYFISHFVTPLVACVWSCAPDAVPLYPASYLFRFLDHHGLLGITGSPTWKTVTGGSRSYVERIGKQITSVHTAAPVRAVHRFPGGVEVITEDATSRRFDSVVVAVHPDQALRLLAEPTAAERQVLGAFRYSRNPVLLHTDTSLLPRSGRARASWNYLMTSCHAPADRVRVSYHMNRLHRFDAPEEYIVTLNGDGRVDEDQVRARMEYEHPLYTPESFAAQQRLPKLSDGVTAFAGAYHGWGFHEDGCRSGVRAAAALGVSW
ncbi:NAD(P)/FAD-dependent oxidoreductase [Streptomyces sp. NPDC002403]